MAHAGLHRLLVGLALLATSVMLSSYLPEELASQLRFGDNSCFGSVGIIELMHVSMPSVAMQV